MRGRLLLVVTATASDVQKRNVSYSVSRKEITWSDGQLKPENESLDSTLS